MAANPMRGEAQLGDYDLVYDFNCFCVLERETGLKFHMLLVTLQTDLGLSDLRDFIWAGLQAKHPGTSVERAGEIIGQVGFKEATDAVQKAMQAIFPPEKGKGKNPRKGA
jgi:hypothetical protein